MVTALKNPTPKTTVRNSVTVAGWGLVSRATGLLRVVVAGAVLGPTYFANVFQTGYVVPHLVCVLIAGPVLSMVLVPGVVRAIGAGGVDEGRELLARVTGWLLAVSGAVVALLMIFSPVVAWTLTLGIPDPAARAPGPMAGHAAGPAHRTTDPAVRPDARCHCRPAGMRALRARRRAPTVENVILILTVILAGWYYGTGLDVQRVPVDLVILLGAGSTAAVALHAALQLFGTARVGLLTRPSMRWRQDSEARAIIRRLVRSVGVAAWPAAAMYVLLALAGTVPGGVFVVQLSHTMLFSLSYVSARAVCMAALPGLSHAAHREDAATFGSAWRQGLSYTVTASLPLLVLLGLLFCTRREYPGQRGATARRPDRSPRHLPGGSGDRPAGQRAVRHRPAGAVRPARRPYPRRASEVAFGVILVAAAAALLLPADGLA